MVKVRATAKGYVGGVLREPGDVFEWPEADKVGSWVKPVAFGSKGDHDGDGLTGGSVATDGDGERDDGEKPKTGKAKKAKPETVKVPTAEPFADAPEPVAVAGNGLQAALGGVQPDWLPPEGEGGGANDQPVMADD